MCFLKASLQMGAALKLQMTIRALVCGAEVVSINIVYEQLRVRGCGPRQALADGANKTQSHSYQHPGLILCAVSHTRTHSGPDCETVSR